MIPGILRTVNKINAEEKVQKQCEIDKEQLVEIQAVFCRPKIYTEPLNRKERSIFRLESNNTEMFQKDFDT